MMERQATMAESKNLVLKSQAVEAEANDTVNLSKKNILLGTFIATFIALTPLIFNIYQSVPEGKTWSTFLFEMNSEYYGSAKVFAWTLMTNISPLMLLTVWFFTCRQWWFHALLVPIAMYIYEVIVILNDDLLFVSNFTIMYMIPVMAVIIPSIYLIRARIFNRINNIEKTDQEIEDELKIGSKTLKGLISQYF